jgi:hypothetical protein
VTTRETLLSTDESLHTMMGRAFDEASKAAAQYGDFASMHEGYGVLAEEVAELFEAVRMRQVVREVSPKIGGGYRDVHTNRPGRIEAEAIQVAAVALRIAEQARRVTR